MEKEYALKYRQLYQHHWWWRTRESIIWNCIRQYAGNRTDLQILDVGCGDGLFFDALGEFGQVRGVEIDDRIVDPRGPHFERIFVGPFDSSYRVEQPLSVVLMLDVLEHLPNPEECLAHAIRLLADDGIVIITVPAFLWLWTRHDDINMHCTRYQKRSFAPLAAAAGMRLDRWEYFFHWLVAAKLAVRLKERLIPGDPKPAALPPAPLNQLLKTVCDVERALCGWMKLPLGTSLLAVGGRQTNTAHR